MPLRSGLKIDFSFSIQTKKNSSKRNDRYYNVRIYSNEKNNSSINTSINIDIKAPVAPKKAQLVKDTYQLAQTAGFTPAQARA